MSDIYASVVPNIIETIDDYFNKYKSSVITTKYENYVKYDIKNILYNNKLSNTMYNDIYNRLINNYQIISLITNIICIDQDSLLLGNYLVNKMNIDLLSFYNYENLDSSKRVLIITTSINIDCLDKYIEIIEKKGSSISGIFSIIGNTYLNYKKNIKYDLMYLIKFDDNEFVDTVDIEYSTNNLIKKNNSDTEDINTKSNDKIIVLSTSTLLSHSKKICKINKDIFELGNIDWKKFTINANIFNKNVLFLMDIHSFIDEQLYILKYISSQKIKNLIITIFYIPYSTSNMINYKGSLHKLDKIKLLCQYISDLSLKKKIDVLVYDILNTNHELYFSNNIILNSLDNKKILIDFLFGQTTVVVYASLEMYNKYSIELKEYPQIFIDNAKNMNKINYPDDLQISRAIIIDRTISDGKRVYETMNLLKNENFKQISAYVEHPDFENDIYLEFLNGGKYEGLYRLYTTDSIPQITEKLPEPFFQILSIIPNVSTDIINICDEDFVNSNKFTVHISDINGTKKKCAFDWG